MMTTYNRLCLYLSLINSTEGLIESPTALDHLKSTHHGITGSTRRVPLNTLSENNILLSGVQRVIMKTKIPAAVEKASKAMPRGKGNFMKPTEAFK